MATQIQQAERFLALHSGLDPLLLPHPWDLGSAKLFASLGFAALATTSSGFAATLGRLDGKVSRDEAIAHAATIVRATDLPVSADLENGFSDSPADVAETIVLAAEPEQRGVSGRGPCIESPHDGLCRVVAGILNLDAHFLSQLDSR